MSDNTDDTAISVTKEEEQFIAKQLDPRLPVTFEMVRREGEHELLRPATSLWWSGLAAGICIGLSVLAQAVLAAYLPDTEWAVLIEKIGYSVGFLVVILGGQQLFTENTLTAVAPLLVSPSWSNFSRLCRLWTIVLIANVAGATLFAATIVFGHAISSSFVTEILHISEHALSFPPLELVWRGVVAGFLIALLVWILARIESGQFAMIVMMTWLIAAGDFAHIIAGSAEAAILVLSGTTSLANAMSEFFLPTLMGNVVGGTALFAMITYAQIKDEMKAPA